MTINLESAPAVPITPHVSWTPHHTWTAQSHSLDGHLTGGEHTNAELDVATTTLR